MPLNKEQAPLQTVPHVQYSQFNYTTNQILDKAQGYWPSILEVLGLNASYLKNKHGPCPICGGKDRFRFDNKNGKGTFFCNNCGAGEGIKLLQLYHDWIFPKALDMVAQVLGIQKENRYSSNPIHISHHVNRVIDNQLSKSDQNNTDKKRKSLNKTWGNARPLNSGDPVDCYLQARCIKLDSFPAILRFHPQLPYYDDDGVLVGWYPAMLALIQNKDDRAVSLHRTYLGNGCKANVEKPKKLMSPIMPGALIGSAIKLFNPSNSKLSLAEGIETALAFHIATQLPIWATISAGGMEKVLLPPSAIDITIAVDNDISGRGAEAASILSKRLISEGRNVKQVMPPTVGYDFADMLMERC